jgi:hypothetical protein
VRTATFRRAVGLILLPHHHAGWRASFLLQLEHQGHGFSEIRTAAAIGSKRCTCS